MAKTQVTISAVLLAVAVVLFTPAFSQAATEFSGSGWVYAPYVATVLHYLPMILIAAAALVLVSPMSGRQR